MSTTHIAATPAPSHSRQWELRRREREAMVYRTPLWDYIRHPRPLVAFSTILIYLCLVPFALLDLCIEIYQTICFPIFGIPRARRGDYFVLDRALLPYLNPLQKLNCLYCSYANGLIGYIAEIAGRTEQRWCPIKHARPVLHPHGRYRYFLPYGNGAVFQKRIDSLSHDFSDLR